MSRSPSSRHTLALALALAGSLLAIPASAEHTEQIDPALCNSQADTASDAVAGRYPDEVAAGAPQGVQAETDFDTDVKGGQLSWKPKGANSLVSSWTVEGPHCPGMVHRLTLSSVGTAPLRWHTRTATATGEDPDGKGTSVEGSTSSTESGNSATITFPATTTRTHEFRVAGSAPGYPEDCIALLLTVSRQHLQDDGDVVEVEEYRSDLRLCKDPDATSYR